MSAQRLGWARRSPNGGGGGAERDQILAHDDGDRAGAVADGDECQPLVGLVDLAHLAAHPHAQVLVLRRDGADVAVHWFSAGNLQLLGHVDCEREEVLAHAESTGHLDQVTQRGHAALLNDRARLRPVG